MNALSRQFLPSWLIVLFVSSITSTSALADLTVIYDSGRTKPIKPLLSPLLSDEEQLGDPANPADSTDQNSLSVSALGPGALSNLLPVRSSGLQVGDLAGSQLKPDVLSLLAQGNPRPFFLIGSDEVSLQWLATHRDTLKTLGAVGMLVQADTEQNVRRVADVAQGLSITLGSGNNLAAALGIHHYPVLITRDGIRQ